MYVIIGATGHTGNATANKLLEQGKRVRAVARNMDHLKPLISRGAEPFAGNVTDKSAMTKAFAGAEAVYLMVPPDYTTRAYYAYADQVGEAFAAAIESNGVKHAVLLSSLGADKTEKTGPILGLRHLEDRLKHISGLNSLFLRPAYFMENTIGQADAVAKMGYTAGPLRPELRFPTIAARDVGEFAANALSRLDFTGHQIQELHGQRDMSYREVTAIIGKAIGQPNLQYVKLTREQFIGALTQMGMSENLASLLAEMTESMDSGYIKPLEPKSARNTTPTSYETFVAESFMPEYQQKLRAA